MKVAATEIQKEILSGGKIYGVGEEVDLPEPEARTLIALGRATEVGEKAEKPATPMDTQQITTRELTEESGDGRPTLRRNRYNRADLRAVDDEAKSADKDPAA